jgi:hypothetical protein
MKNDIFSKKELMDKFLNKISDGEIHSIQSMEIKKHKKIKFIDCLVQGYLPHSVDLVDSTKLHLNYYGLNTKGLYWEISDLSRIEKMLIDVFGLRVLGIDDVVLNNVNKHSFSI